MAIYLDKNKVAPVIKIGVEKPTQSKTVTPTTSLQVVEADAGYELSGVVVEGVTNEIDGNIQSRNIAKDITILGVTGTFEGDSGALKLLDGTEDNPTILSQLESGEYYLKGYFKYNSFGNTSNICNRYNRNSFSDETVKIRIRKYSDGSINLDLFGATFGYFLNTPLRSCNVSQTVSGNGAYFNITNATFTDGANSFCAFQIDENNNNYITAYRSPMMYATYSYDDSGSIEGVSVLTTNNSKSYTPTEPYHPATKEFAENASKIRMIDSPQSVTDNTQIGKLYLNKDFNDNNLYIIKKVGENHTYGAVSTYTKYDRMIILDSIFNVDFSVVTWGSFSATICLFTVNNESKTIYLDFVVTNGVLVSIQNRTTKEYYYSDGTWRSHDLIPSEMATDKEYVKVGLWGFNSTGKLDTTALTAGFNQVITTDVVKAFKIPLQEVTE